MTTRYHLPEGSTSVSADGLHFVADENGQIDLAGAHPTTIATLVEFAGIRLVRSEADIILEAAAAAERVRFEAAVAEMMKGAQAATQAETAHVETDLNALVEAAATEVDTAERTVREAVLAAAPVEAVSSAETEPAAEADPRSVMPPKRRKNA